MNGILIVKDAETQNIEKILDIQSSLISGKVFGAVNYPAFTDLAKKGRVFIKETDFRKVCRKSNKLFRFWLFNDCMIYGKLIENGRYIFHRKIDLITCSISAYQSSVYKNALEITGAEKSFIAMAESEYEQIQWLRLVSHAIIELGGSQEVEYFYSPNTPISVDNDRVSTCQTCHQVILSA